MPIDWTETTVPLSALRPWERNPKTISKAHAKRLLANWQELGQWQTLSIGPDGELYDGHQRASVLKAAFGADYSVKVLQSSRPLTDAERGRIAFEGTVGAVGQIDWEVAAGFDAEALQGWGMDAETLRDWKRDTSALDNFIKSNEPEVVDAEPQIDRAAELNKKWQVSEGQLWLAGEHRILCGDSRNMEDVKRIMQGEVAGLVFTDPPYNIGAKIENDNLSDGDFDAFNIAWLSEIPADVSCGFVCYHSTRNFPSVLINAKSDGWNFERMLWYYVPDKFPAHSWKHWMMVSQAIMLFSKGEVVYANTESDQDCYKMTSADLGISNGHPTEKREENCRRVMSHYSSEIVYEPFGGSGTTLVACNNLGKKCRMIEIDPKFVAVTLERLSMIGLEPFLSDL